PPLRRAIPREARGGNAPHAARSPTGRAARTGTDPATGPGTATGAGPPDFAHSERSRGIPTSQEPDPSRFGLSLRSGPDQDRRPDRRAVPLVSVIRPLVDPPLDPLRLTPRGTPGGGRLRAPGRAGPGWDGRGLQGEAREAQARGRLE